MSLPPVLFRRKSASEPMSGMNCFVPTPVDLNALLANQNPPPVGDRSTAGTGMMAARDDHTHLSSVFKAVKATTDATGTVSWTYPDGFFAVAPVIQLTIETTSGQPMAALVTSNTASGGTAQVLRAQMLPATILTLSGLVNFNVYGAVVPTGTKVHVYAAKATVVTP